MQEGEKIVSEPQIAEERLERSVPASVAANESPDDMAVDAPATERTKKQKLKALSGVVLAILVCGVARAVAVHFFITPNGFAPGGLTGISAILYELTGVSVGIYLFVLNIPLFVLGFFFIGKKFTVISLAATFLTSGIILLFEFFNIAMDDPPDQKILSAIAAGVLTGFAIAVIFRVGGSTGGTDIIVILINKKFQGVNVSSIMFVTDILIVSASYFVYKGIEPLLIAVVEMFSTAKMLEAITEGMRSAVKYEIVTTKPEEIAKAIFTYVKRGVTMTPAKGMFSGQEKAVLTCIIGKRQVSAFNKMLKAYESDAFVYISKASQVMGRGFRSV